MRALLVGDGFEGRQAGGQVGSPKVVCLQRLLGNYVLMCQCDCDGGLVPRRATYAVPSAVLLVHHPL